MHKKHVPARAMSLLSVALLLGAGLPLFAASPAEAGARYFEEDWEFGSSGWTYSTDKPVAQQDCTGRFAYRGLCSIEVNAQVRGQISSVSRTFTNLQFAGAGYVISDYFQAEFPYAHSGGARIVEFANGLKATLNLSYGTGNMVALSANNANTGALRTPSGQTWMYQEETAYRTLLKVDLVNHNLRIEVRATNDSLLATGPAIVVPAGSASTITRIAYEGYYFGSNAITDRPAKINYDWLTITGPDAPTAPLLLTAAPGPGLGQITVSWQKPSDDGGVPLLHYNVYRGDTASNVTTLIGNVTTRTFVDSGMQNGETHYYAASAVNAAGEGALSNVFVSTTFNVPTAPRNLIASPGTTTGDIRLTWQAPANTGGTTISSYRVFRGEESGATTLLAEVAGNAFSYTDKHLPNGSRWYYNVTAVNIVGEGPSSNEASALPKPDAATAATNMVLKPDPWWTEQARQLNFTYSVSASQCAPTETCPVTHEWRVYQDGSLGGADGILLASGTNTHSGHAETTTYNVGTIVTPTGLDGSHTLKVVVNAREGSTQWRLASLSFQNGIIGPDPACNANPGFYTYVMPGVVKPNETGWRYTKTYGYKLNGTLSAHRAVFVDGCPANGPAGPGDGFYEIGYGGILLDASAAGTTIQLPDSTGNPPTFVIGTDMDNSGYIGDSPLDCFQGPYTFSANITCPVDATGHTVLVLVPSVPSVPDPNDVSIWGRGIVCLSVQPRTCFYWWIEDPTAEGGSGKGPGYQRDSNGDKMGDAWKQNVDDTMGTLDKWLNGVNDLEFLTPCSIGCAEIGNRPGDRLQNVDEFRWLTHPIGPLRFPDCSKVPVCDIFPNARDYDQDNWEDGEEHAYWNNPDNDPLINDEAWTTIEVSVFDPDAKLDLEKPNGDGLGTLHDPDNDNDGLLDGHENKTWRSYPELADSDCALEEFVCSLPGPTYWSPHQGKPGTGDQMDDGPESAAWGDTWDDDQDHDGIDNNLLDPDSDSDGILDGLEFPVSVGGKCAALCTDPGKFDTDGDGLLDGDDIRLLDGDFRVRLFIEGSIAYIRDSTGYTFYGEVKAGTNRTNPDTDGDGLPDGWEYKYLTDPLFPTDTASTDGDGWSNLKEYSFECPLTPCPVSPVYWGGTNPSNADTDGDLLQDHQEDRNGNGVADPCDGHPLEPDTDFDGIKDGVEVAASTCATKPDSDGDRLTDYQEMITYASKGVFANLANSDSCCNSTGNDTLDDYQELMLYRTNASGYDLDGNDLPDGWDTDGDGLADGRDSRPLLYDAPPVQREIPALNPLRPSYTSYVTFRPEGYIDVFVKDAHGAEGDIELVEVWVQLNGTMEGDDPSQGVLVREEARRLDEGGTWGVRIPLPEKMGEVTKELFRLTVVSTDGNSIDADKTTSEAYSGEFEVKMSRVAWKPESDPAGNWQALKVHESIPRENAVAAGYNGAPLVPSIDPWALSLDDLFDVFGNFTVYRLKPGAIWASELENATAEVGNTSMFAIAHPINATLGAENASAFVDFTYYEDAFELVNPLLEPGVYASLATGWGDIRTPKFIRTGVHKAWNGLVDTATREGASFLFGSDDPRAQGAVIGDIVSGILVYGDVRDCFWKEDAITVTLGCIGIALTFVGPQADGPFAAFKAGVKTLTTIPTVGVKIAGKFASDVSGAVDVAKQEKNALKALEFLVKQCASASWLKKNRAKALPFDNVQTAVPAHMRNALGDELPLTVDYAESLRAAYPNNAEVNSLLTTLTNPNTMFPNGGEQGLQEIGPVIARVRTEQPGAGAADFAKGIGYAAAKDNGANKMPGIENAASWKNDIFSGVTGNNELGRKGFILEGKIVGRCGDGFYKIVDQGGNERIIKLTKLDQTYTRVEMIDADGNVVEVTVQVDVQGVLDGAGIPLFIDAKSAAEIGSKEKGQLERYAALAKQQNGEVIWMVEGTPTTDFLNHVGVMAQKYGVRIHILDADSGLPLIQWG